MSESEHLEHGRLRENAQVLIIEKPFLITYLDIGMAIGLGCAPGRVEMDEPVTLRPEQTGLRGCP